MTTTPTTTSITTVLSAAGIELDTSKAKAARRNLYNAGAVSANLPDDVAVAADMAARALNASEGQIKRACYIAGALRKAESWKEAQDDDGKAFKSENAFLKALFPGYAASTVTLYADVGATIYLPAAAGELDDLPGVADLGPSNAKFLLNSIKDADKRKRLPAALNDATAANKGKLTQKAINAAVKSLSASPTSPQTGASASTAASVADELSGGSLGRTISSLISFTYTGDNRDGDLTAVVVERDVKDFLSFLLKARDDKQSALVLADTLYQLAKKAR